MRTSTVAILLGVAVLGGLTFPTVHGADDCPDCEALRDKHRKETTALRERVVQLTDRNWVLKEDLEMLKKEQMSLSAAVGFWPDKPGGISSDVAAIQKFVKDELRALPTRDSVVVPANGYTEAFDGGFAVMTPQILPLFVPEKAQAFRRGRTP